MQLNGLLQSIHPQTFANTPGFPFMITILPGNSKGKYCLVSFGN